MTLLCSKYESNTVQTCKVGRTEENNILCERPTKYHQKLTTYFSQPTPSGCSIASGIIVLELFPKELEKAFQDADTHKNTHLIVSNVMQTWVGITGSGGSVRIHFTEVKFEVGGMEHTQFPGKHILSDTDILVIVLAL